MMPSKPGAYEQYLGGFFKMAFAHVGLAVSDIAAALRNNWISVFMQSNIIVINYSSTFFSTNVELCFQFNGNNTVASFVPYPACSV